MNLPFSYQQKIKIAILLFCIMVCTLFIRILEDKSLKSVSIAFSSMYNDRLIPATDLFKISEHLNAKRQLLDSYFHKTEDKDISSSVLHLLETHNTSIAHLLKKYEETFLVSSEEKNLLALKKMLQENNTVETSLVASSSTLSEDERKKYYLNHQNSYAEILKSISTLTKIQSKIGEELIKDSQKIIKGTELYATIQFILALTIGILIVSILSTSNIIKIKSEKFNLN